MFLFFGAQRRYMEPVAVCRDPAEKVGRSP
jgi:hypothetical protein